MRKEYSLRRLGSTGKFLEITGTPKGETYKKYAEGNAPGCAQTSDDVAALVAFLWFDDSDYFTGHPWRFLKGGDVVTRRFGYRRIGIMLERKGMVMNEKKLYRIYREEGLSVRRRRGRKRARGSRTPMPVPLLPNQRWSLDFLADTFGPAAGSAFWL